MQDEMARAGSGIELSERRIIGRERSLNAVELVDQQLVEAQVVDHGEAVVGRGVEGGGGAAPAGGGGLVWWGGVGEGGPPPPFFSLLRARGRPQRCRRCSSLPK